MVRSDGLHLYRAGGRSEWDGEVRQTLFDHEDNILKKIHFSLISLEKTSGISQILTPQKCHVKRPGGAFL